MSTELRVGVVGAGIGAGYIAGLQKQSETSVTALCARTPNRAAALAQRYGVPRTYTDYAEMLEREVLDAVVIATPNHLHHAMTLAALNAGKHVLCDKPLALCAAQAAQMADCAERAKLRHFVPFTWRFLPAALYMNEILQRGFAGQIYHVNVRYYVCGWGDPQGPMRWQYDAEQAGSGALANLGSHVIHLVDWWVGPIRRLSAKLTTSVKERISDGGRRVPVRVDDSCAMIGELDDGVPVVFHISSVALCSRIHLEIGVFGSDGSLVFQDDWGAPDAMTGRLLAMRKNDQAPSPVPIPARLTGEFAEMPDYYTPVRSCFGRMAAEFVNAIRENRDAHPNFHDGVRVQQVLDAALASAAENRWVTVA